MKKAILISIRPEWVAKILNKEKTIEIRKTAPKCKLPVDVYIYCTKSKDCFLEKKIYLQECEFCSYEWPNQPFKAFVAFLEEAPVGKEQFFWVDKKCLGFDGDGKVLATVGEKVRQEIDDIESDCFYASPSVNGKVVAKFTLKAANRTTPFYPSLGRKGIFYDWHISDLEVFDGPKDLSDFGLKHAPQSWQYVEVER